MEGDLRDRSIRRGILSKTSVRYSILGKISTVKGQADGTSLREGSVRAIEVRVVDTPAVGEHGRYGEGEGIEKKEPSVVANTVDKAEANNQTSGRGIRRSGE